MSKLLISRNSLRKLLGQAFDYGYESCYELKEDILEDILDKLDRNHSDYINKLFDWNQVPYPIRSLLAEFPHDSMLAGGSLFKILKKGTWDTDWDIFVNEDKFSNIYDHYVQHYAQYQNNLEPRLLKGTEYISKKQKFIVYEIFDASLNCKTGVQFMVYKAKNFTPTEIIASFDLSVCQFYAINQSIYFTPEAIEDFMNQTTRFTKYFIDVLKTNNKKVINKSVSRLTKYETRGISISQCLRQLQII